MGRKDNSHYRGTKCGYCLERLEADDCCPGEPHGDYVQERNDFSRRMYPDHPCFQMGRTMEVLGAWQPSESRRTQSA